MSNLKAARVSDAIRELDETLREYIDQEYEHGVPREVSAKSILGEMPVDLVTLLLEHLPTIARPWRVVDMRDGEPTRLVRDGYGDTIATVRRSTARRGGGRWAAFVGNEVVSPPPESAHVDWPTCRDAQAVCDARLAHDGVVVMEPVGG